jgi:SRSO17 transposase
VLDLEEDAVAASWTVADGRHARWEAGFEDMFALVAGEFAQVESRRRARLYVLGLLSGSERKNSWTIAELAGDRSPEGMQRLLNHYRWDAGAVRDVVRGYVLGSLADSSGVVVADETGFLKKGTKSAGVQRQYSGTAGRIENCQLGVFLTYVSAKGRALIDRELYLPEGSWCDDRERCREAGIDDEVEFETKPGLARRMLERLLDSGADVGWFTADEAYGDNPGLRAWLDECGLSYVMAISCDHRFDTPAGRRRADELARKAGKKGWQCLSAGEGSKGQRLYDWLLLDPGESGGHLLLVRRSISKPSELAYYICHSTYPAPLAELVRVAGSRWAVEETFQFAKNETGLDHYQVRKYEAWYRHITLSMLAAAFLAVTASHERAPHQKGASQPSMNN